MGRIGMPEVILIALVIIILFGSKKLPEIGSALGKALKEFKKAARGLDDEVKEISEDKNNEKKS